MKVLGVINRYPPRHLGGYELRFMDLMTGLSARGHRTMVLTSDWGDPMEGPEPGVLRRLGICGEVHGIRGVLGLARRSFRDGRTLERVLRSLRPDVVLLGDLGGLTSALFNVLAASPARVVCDVSNEWLFEILQNHGNWFRIWERPSRSPVRGALKAFLRVLLRVGPRELRPRFPGVPASAVSCTAEHLARRCIEFGGDAIPAPRVLSSGIPLEMFPYRPTGRRIRSLLYVGRIKPTKGIATAIRALSHLEPAFRLTIVGVREDRQHAMDLEREVADLGLADRVRFREPVERAEIAGLLSRHDALVFPSEWDEAFSRLLLEAMAVGLPVIATPEGGTRELVEPGRNGLLFDTGDPVSLARSVARLAADAPLAERLRKSGRRTVEQRFSFSAYLERVEAMLLEVLET